MNVAVCAAVFAAVLGQPPSATPSQPTIPLTFRPAAAPVPALKYRLVSDLTDRQPGNAATWWLRAGGILAERRLGLTDKHYDWANYDAPAGAVPPEEVRQLLAAAQPALDLADRAARRDRCEWDETPLTLRGLAVPLPEAQRFRELSAVLGLRFRRELSERNFDAAARTLQTGLALARHSAEGGSVIHALIGLSIGASTLRHAEEWIRTPGSPNLYWALTTAPQPLIGLRKPFENELGILHHSFPALRGLDRATKTPEEMRRLGEELTRALHEAYGQPKDEWAVKLTLAGLTTATYPEAKQYLRQHGRTAAQVEDMPALQAVLVYVLEEYDRWRDDTLKWAELPYHQAGPGLRRTRQQLAALGPSLRVLPLTHVVPTLERVAFARARVERKLAGLRCVEALRLYAAAHDGRLPGSLEEITEVPVPADPMTGRPFGYSVKGGRAWLAAPPPAGEPVSPDSAWRYELTVKQ
jgi:hypothetical protein